MNRNKEVFLFVLITFLFVFSLSIFDLLSSQPFDPIKNINILSDLNIGEIDNKSSVSDSVHYVEVESEIDTKNFNLYRRSSLITDFKSDTNLASLPNFHKKLRMLKDGKKIKVRIAYFGDSMIEGDLLTQTLRKKLQEYFGGYGVGFISITSIVSGFRQTAEHNYSGNWNELNFSNYNASDVFLSGRKFIPNDDWVFVKDRTFLSDTAALEKCLITGKYNDVASIYVGIQNKQFQSPKNVNRILLEYGKTKAVKVSFPKQQLPVYGVSLESPYGVILDNFSYRGISGIELSRFDSAFLVDLNSENKYDLIIIQYGVNLLYKPQTVDFRWYVKKMTSIISRFKKFMPDTDVMIISTGDRAFRVNGKYESSKGVDSLVNSQAKIAYETQSAFFNLYSTMGGKNSIIEWADKKPSLANKDYVHPNHRGAELLGLKLFESLIRDYRKVK